MSIESADNPRMPNKAYILDTDHLTGDQASPVVRRAFLLGIGILAMLLTLPIASVGFAQTLSPTSAPPDATVTVTESGLTPSSSFTIFVAQDTSSDNLLSVQDCTSDASGTLVQPCAFTVPDQPPDTYPVEVDDAEFNAVGTTSLTILAPAATP